MRLLHVITGLNVGGAETMLARLLEHRAQEPCFHPAVLTLMPPGRLAARVCATGTPVYHLDMQAGLPSPGAVARLARTVRAMQPDLLVGWMHHGQIAASLGALFARGRPPVVWNVRHSLSGFAQEKPMTRALLRMGAMLSRTSAAITYNSEAAASQYGAFGFRPRRQMVIDNGFDLGAFAGREEARARIRRLFAIRGELLLIGLIARHHEMKDVPSGLTAFSRLLEAGVDAHLLIVGEGMEAVAESLPGALPAGRVTISGHRDDVAAWMAGLDMLMLSSAWGEGFPNIVGEAMAARVPCVVTDVGDAGRVVGDTGRVVAPRDPAALADALLALARLDPGARAALGEQARARVAEHFPVDRAVRRFHALFREVAGERAGASRADASAPLKAAA